MEPCLRKGIGTRLQKWNACSTQIEASAHEHPEYVNEEPIRHLTLNPKQLEFFGSAPRGR